MFMNTIHKMLFTTIFLWFLNFIIVFAQPQIKFDSLEYNIPPIKKGQNYTLKIPYKNIGNKPLIITQASGSGTPSIFYPKEPIYPGKSDFITFKMPANFVGKTTQNISVNTNIDNKSIFLKIKMQIIENEIPQNNTLKNVVFGKVTDKNNEPVAYATIFVEGTNIVTVTDIEGNYTIKAPLDSILVFSFVGMKTEKILIETQEINIKLQEIPIEGGIIPPFREPHKLKRDTPPHSTVSVKDLKNANNASYNFKKNLKNNALVLYYTDTLTLNNKDLDFQKKYALWYSPISTHSKEYQAYTKKYNLLTFKYLNKKYKKDWQINVRKDVVGLEKFTK